jgi:hypothetical protein
MSPNLTDIFSAIAHKRLVQVDLPRKGSNQHELNGSVALRDFFETSEKVAGVITWHYFVDDREPEQEEGTFTFYDARAKSAARTGRTEWRFYYTGEFLARCEEGDELILVRTKDASYHALIFRSGSAWLRSSRLLFGIESTDSELGLISRKRMSEQVLALVKRQILDALDLNLELTTNETDKELVARNYGSCFPTTKEMSAFARGNVIVDPLDADTALLAWLDREEQLFRALEAVIIGERIGKGFNDVDEFIRFSLSVQNRRKSRMGHALQNHLNEVFSVAGIRFQEQVKTESGNKPDFIFPGESEYHNMRYDASLLVMLGVKSSAKDRWRQILPEARRVSEKHLCTLQAGISENQTKQMKDEHVRLVIPAAVHTSYSDAQREQLLDVTAFIELVRSKQG